MGKIVKKDIRSLKHQGKKIGLKVHIKMNCKCLPKVKPLHGRHHFKRHHFKRHHLKHRFKRHHFKRHHFKRHHFKRHHHRHHRRHHHWRHHRRHHRVLKGAKKEDKSTQKEGRVLAHKKEDKSTQKEGRVLAHKKEMLELN